MANKKNLALTGVEDPVTYNNRGALTDCVCDWLGRDIYTYAHEVLID